MVRKGRAEDVYSFKKKKQRPSVLTYMRASHLGTENMKNRDRDSYLYYVYKA